MNTTEQGNKVIAEFEGAKKKRRVTSSFVGTIYEYSESVHYRDRPYYTPDTMKYHTSWDWLMPVCIKLGIEVVSTDINKTYNDVVNRIMEANTRV